MQSSSRASRTDWCGPAGQFPVNTPEADAWPRPNSNAGGGTLMDLVASCARTSRPRSPGTLPPRTAVPSPHGPFSTRPGGRSSGADSVSHGAMPQATSDPWPASLGEGGRMSGVAEAESTRRSEHSQFHQPGMAVHLGGEWVGSAQQSITWFSVDVPVVTSSSSFSEADLNTLSSFIINDHKTVGEALGIMGRKNLPEASVRRWLADAGVKPAPSSVRLPPLSLTQVEKALRAQAAFVKETGHRYGSIKAAHEALGGEDAVPYSTFTDYFCSQGVSNYGRTMLERAYGSVPEVADEEKKSAVHPA